MMIPPSANTLHPLTDHPIRNHPTCQARNLSLNNHLSMRSFVAQASMNPLTDLDQQLAVEQKVTEVVPVETINNLLLGSKNIIQHLPPHRELTVVFSEQQLQNK